MKYSEVMYDGGRVASKNRRRSGSGLNNKRRKKGRKKGKKGKKGKKEKK